MSSVSDNVGLLRERIQHCTLCPRACGVDRIAGQIGACRIGAEAVVVSVGPHFGEEPMLVGHGGSGTIFFAGCNLDCVFCQNCDISHGRSGRPTSPAELADVMIRLVDSGCENVNFVTPTHVSHAVAEAIVIARSKGLTAPTVYNCGGYESVEALEALEGLIDIYMPDFKWADAAAGETYSGVPDYPSVAEAALAEMHRQVGPIQLDSRGVATRGVLVRHLIMPNDLARSEDALEIIARAAPGCAVNVMGQYRPAFRAAEFPELMATPSAQDVADLRRHADRLGLARAN
ncbi:MAG: radical SAM protein [Planctomycetota bacterium]|jgi:putative pyruvate formate lyase activating enzyme